MAKAAPKTSTKAAKKAPAKKTAAKKAAMKNNPAKTSPAKTNPAKTDMVRNPMMVPLLLGALLIGVVLGTTFNSANKSAMSDADFDAKVAQYIDNNAGVVIEALNNHMRKLADADRANAINMVKANDGNTVLGNPNGDVTIYEFADYNCGYCKRAFNDVMAAVQEDGNIRLVIKEFPILSETSLMAAQISMAAAELGRYEEVHSALMMWQGPLDEAAIEQIVTEQGLDLNELAAIIAKGEIDAALDDIKAVAQQINITGTPGFVIGNELAPGYIPKEQILELVQLARAE